MTNLRRKTVKAFLILLFVLMSLNNAQAQTDTQVNSYYLESVKVDIQINKDTTFDIYETMEYSFMGDFDYLAFDFPFVWENKIEVISITNEENNINLKEIYNPTYNNQKKESRDGYWIEDDNNNYKLFWTVDQKNQELKTWTIHYKVDGGIFPFEICIPNDEFQWTFMHRTDAEKINKLEVYVRLPERQEMSKMLASLQASEEVEKQTKTIFDNQTFYFSGDNIYPSQEFKVIATWPKGLFTEKSIFNSSVFNFIDWEFIIYRLLGLVMFIVFLFFFIPAEDKKRFADFVKKSRELSTISENDSTEEVIEHTYNLVSNEDLPSNVIEMTASIFCKERDLLKIEKSTIKHREKISLIKFIIVAFILFVIFSIVSISPQCLAIFLSDIWMSSENLIKIIFILLPFIIFTVMLLIWRKYGKDDKIKTIVPQYEPPKGIDIVTADFIFHNKTSNKLFPSIIVDMSLEGLIKIEELSEYNEYNKIKFPQFIILLPLLFLSLILFTFLDMKSFIIYLAIVAIVSYLLPSIIKKINDLVYSGSTKNIKLTYNKNNLTDKKLNSLYALIIYVLFKDNKSIMFDELKRTTDNGFYNSSQVKYISGILKIKNLIKTTPRQYFTTTVYKWSKLFGVILSVLGFLIFILFLLLFSFNVSVDYLLLLVFNNLILQSIIFSLIIFLVFQYFMSNRTREGNEIYRHLLGFKMYLEKAERFRMSECDLKTFDRYLPYAMIFGVEKKWKNRFSGIIDFREKDE